MNQIADLLPASNVLLGLDASSKSRLFEAIGVLFETTRGLSRQLVIDSLTAREKLGSTGLGQGIAIPHGRIKGLAEAQGAFARLAEPIAFDAPDGKPVSQVFVLLVPEHATEQHLQLLSELAQMFSDRGFRDELRAADSAPGVHAVFANWQSVG
jgi:PTS system nitrogen regulatory IIA component